jgi:sensor histidine kinase regulating citrate/malate metabolism
MIIEKEHCDYYLEVYWWDYTLVDKVATKKEKNVLAFIGLYRDYELEFEDQLTILTNLRENLISAYMNWPDGEVAVELTIKEEGVNL